MKKNKNGTLKAEIMDVEGDFIQLTFNNDFCVTLNTDEYSYLTLTEENLHEMLELLEKSEEIYAKP